MGHPTHSHVKLVAVVALCLVAALSGSTRLSAMPANPNPISETQPDGSSITLQIRGDEYFHWYEDTAGFTVLHDAAGAYVYASKDPAGELVPTTLRVGAGDPAGAGLSPGLMPPPDRIARLRASKIGPASGVPKPVTTTGTVKNVVILMQFSNHTTRPKPTNRDMGMIFNHVGPHPLCPTGSVRDHYLENSYGAFVLDSTIFGWVTLPQSEAYYANGQAGTSEKIHEAITAALNAADALIDFSAFDADKDSFVDAIAFIHSGYGAEWGGTDQYGANEANRIWSHRWNIPVWTSAEGVRVSDYHISPALWDISGVEPGRIGVICHETGHFFGLPDLYDTDYSSEGIGNWCLMSGGSWGFNDDQLYPSHMSAWCKVQLGWVAPTILTPGEFTANRVQTTSQIFKITSGYPDGEYLLIENRQPFGFDAAIPQGGLAIWHIDETKYDNNDEGYPGQNGWPANKNHYLVALLQADGLYHLERGQGRGDAGDLYHSFSVASISPFTVPNTNAYQNGVNTITYNQVTQIGASGSAMSFTYGLHSGPSPSPSPTPTISPTPTQAPIIDLENGIPVTELQGTKDSERRYKIAAPAGTTKLHIEISGGPGDCDLYVRYGHPATTQAYNFRPFLDGNDESVDVTNPPPGNWYVLLHGYEAYANVKLLAYYCPSVPCDNLAPSPTPTPSPIPTAIDLINGVPVIGIAGPTGSQSHYKIAAPAGATNLRIQTSGGTGDCDMYVRHAQPPSLNTFDFRPYLAGNAELVEVAEPAAGDWYVTLQGYDTFEGVTLLASFCPSGPCASPTPLVSPTPTVLPSPTAGLGNRLKDVLLGRVGSQSGDDLNGDGAVDITDLLYATSP